MMDAPELKPCPFCGHTAYHDTATAVIMGKRTGHMFAIACRWCEASAPGHDAWIQAVQNWNTRSDLPPTLAAALVVPEVAGMVSAATKLRGCQRDFAVSPSVQNSYHVGHAADALDTALAALRAAKGGE